MKNLLLLATVMLTFLHCNDKGKTENSSANKTTALRLPENFKKEGFILTSDSVKLHYKISGTGKPCLYIHGGPGQGFDSFESLKGNSLEQKLEMIYFDQRGSGNSGNAKDYHLNNMLNDIETIRKKLGVEKFFVLAHSFGGIIATAYAEKYPQHVEGLILANCTLNFFNAETTNEQIAFADSLLGKKSPTGSLAKKDLMPVFLKLRSELSKKHLGYRFITDDVKTIVEMDKLDSLHPRNTDFGMNVITNQKKYPEYYEDYTKITKNIKVPTLVITGKSDHAVGINHYKNFHFPDETIASLKGGHLLYYENNKDFNNAVFKFIEKN